MPRYEAASDEHYMTKIHQKNLMNSISTEGISQYNQAHLRLSSERRAIDEDLISHGTSISKFSNMPRASLAHRPPQYKKSNYELQ